MTWNIGDKVKVSHDDNPNKWCIGTIMDVCENPHVMTLKYTEEEAIKSLKEGLTLLYGTFYYRCYKVELR